MLRFTSIVRGIIWGIGLAALGCASAPVAPEYAPQSISKGKPCWLMAPCAPYGTGIYLVGVGGGADQQEADDAARADLAKIIKVQVHESLELVEKSYSTTGIYGVRSVYSETINRDVRTETDLQVEGVEVVRRYQDGSSFHALAVLERGPALARTDARLTELDAEMEKLVTRSGESDAIAGLKDLAQASALSRDYAGLNGQRTVIEGGGEGRPPKHSPEDLSHRLETLLKGVGITLVVDGEASGALETAVADELTAHGFQLVPEDGARLILHGVLKTEITDADSYGFRKLSGDLSLTLKDIPAAGARIYRVLNFSASASSRKKQKARNIVLADLEKALRNKEEGGALLGDQVISALLGETSGDDAK